MSISGDLSDDRTDQDEFRMEHVDRLLAWEWIHCGRCAGRNLQSYVLAERLGLTTAEMHELERGAIGNLAEEWKGRHGGKAGYDTIRIEGL